MYQRITNVAVCTVNQWAMDFTGNKQRIIKTCEEAHQRGAHIRLGPELEITGYGSLDHFYEKDCEWHSWEVLGEIVAESCKWPDLLVITGLPITYKSALYNCMAAVGNGKLLFLYPKTVLANDDIYRESRWFVSWQKPNEIVNLRIDSRYGISQTHVPFGNGIMETTDGVKIGFEMCEELWTANSPSSNLALHGVEIFCNSSGSHHVLGKSFHRINQLVLGTTSKLGGVYLYANQRGCDGDRLYYDGMSTIAQNDKIYAQIDQFDIEDTCVANAVLELSHSITKRRKMSSLCQQSSKVFDIPHIQIDLKMLETNLPTSCTLSKPLKTMGASRSNVEELCNGPPAWLWHYLRRSKMGGFFLPLSGGQDSCAVALMVRLMCEKVCRAIKDNPGKDDPSYYLNGEKMGINPDELCKRVFYTCYMATEYSSDFTKGIANSLAADINSNHLTMNIDGPLDSIYDLLESEFGSRLSFESSDDREGLALQNTQARLRMLLSYLLAQTCLINKRPGNLLVLGSANVDESLVGYLTKYDCSSADINPIGSVSKHDLREFLQFVNGTHRFASLGKIINSIPSAELRPPSNGQITQTDEDEIGLTYEELSIFGQLRRPGCCGPYAMFQELINIWYPNYSYHKIADKVKRFYLRYAINRHKATISTPAYHANTYSNDDHRNDHRPFLYPDFKYQFQKIEHAINVLNHVKAE